MSCAFNSLEVPRGEIKSLDPNYRSRAPVSRRDAAHIARTGSLPMRPSNLTFCRNTGLRGSFASSRNNELSENIPPPFHLVSFTVMRVDSIERFSTVALPACDKASTLGS